ncbi:DinB family protein [Dactylosporangium vinaceum]|uniref:DinB family protein n=1 Tax=Dactylosporangium vinaceum TaxID=53362 RepID=A0ABV5MGQ7_9ACTN|nr:DinB family protein [Dactylosporangium vinaceum]UAB94990.1 DinB family protein [Dactylosporangium vinaceum]
MIGTETELLTAALDAARETVHRKCAGIPDALGRLAPLPASPLTTPVGLVQHLTAVESYWFEIVVAGRDVPKHWTAEDPDLDWRPRLGLAEALERYRAQCAVSRSIAAGRAPDAVCAGTRHGEPVSMRWVFIHMIEETARHNGHLDAVREFVDGVVGD